MAKTLILQGKLAFPNMVTENTYSGKKQFNLTFPTSLTAKIEDAIRQLVDGEQHAGFYDSIEFKKIKSGETMVAKGYENFKGRDFMVLKQDGFGWELNNVADQTIDAEEFGMDDGVRVLLSIGSTRHPKHGAMVFLNPKIIKLVKSEGNAGGSGYSLDGDALGEVIEADEALVKADAALVSDGEDLF